MKGKEAIALVSYRMERAHERTLPELVPRNKELPQVQGKANVIIGMRRAGKTWFCFARPERAAAISSLLFCRPFFLINVKSSYPGRERSL